MKLEDAFGITLRKYRRKAGLSQEALALNCDLDRTFVSALERGIRQPSLKSIFKLSKALGVRPANMINEIERLIEKNGL